MLSIKKYWTITSFWPINIEKKTLIHVKNIKFDSFKCCTASTTATGVTLAHDSVSHAQHDTSECRPTNLRSGKTLFSVPI